MIKKCGLQDFCTMPSEQVTTEKKKKRLGVGNNTFPGVMI